MWAEIKNWFKGSITILWARIIALAGVVLINLTDMSDSLQAIGLDRVLDAKIVPYYLVAIGIRRGS